jgi:hypothetical protein
MIDVPGLPISFQLLFTNHNEMRLFSAVSHIQEIGM